MTEKNTLYLIDGTAYIYRSFHAIRNLRNENGFPTNAIFGFTRTLIKLMETHSPEYAVMVFDSKGKTFRHEMYDQYKANRPPMPEDLVLQVPLIRDVSAWLGLQVVEVPGVEADDVIGTLSRMAQENGFQVVMVTGDKDFGQLITDRAVIFDPMKDITLTTESLTENLGVAPGQVIEMMALTGDTSDNVPGVPGIGPKTAAKLIQTYGTLESLYENIDSVAAKKQKENLLTHRDNAFLSRDLVTIKQDVDVAFSPDALRVSPPDKKALSAFFAEMNFRQLQKDFQPAADMSVKDYQAVTTAEALEKVIRAVRGKKMMAIDTETTSQHPMHAALVGISICCTAHQAVYIPIAHVGDPGLTQMEPEAVRELVGPLLEDPEILKIGQNFKYDRIVLERHGFTIRGPLFDTMLADYLLHPTRRSHGLDQMALSYFNHKTITFEDVAGKGKNQILFSEVPLDQAVPYASEDADITFMLYEKLAPMLREKELSDLFEQIEMPLMPVLADMEQTGVRIDTKALTALSKTMADELETLEAGIHELAGETFNIKSSQQLGQILFEKLGLPMQKKTKKKTGYSTDVEVLTALAPHHPLPEKVLRHRTLVKLKSTYADALLDLIHPETGRIHTSFNQTVTATGRLSSSDPNLQNIPIRTEDGRKIRSAFIPREGWTMVAADYSQIELRILAHLSGDPILIDAFMNNQDIHTRTAEEVFEVIPAMVTSDLRRQAKAINFGIIYGMSPFGLSRDLGISQKMAKTYIEHYFRRYRKVREFIDSTIETVRETQVIHTVSGRLRPFPDIASSNRTVRQFAERSAVNTLIQGSAADLMKIAMIRVHDLIRENGWQTAMLLSVHDELVFEVPPEEMETVPARIQEAMETVMDLSVPLVVNSASGANWTEAH